MNNLYVLQDRNYGLGNFINLTPVLQSLAKHLDKPIPVYFELKHVEQCFTDCEFIEILEKQPYERALFTSGLVDTRNHLPDYIFAHRELSKMFPLDQEIPHTYVDSAKEIPEHRRSYTLFMYGSGNEDPMYMSTKTPDREYYQQYMHGPCIFTGSKVDFERTDWFADMENHTDDIRKSLALIRDAPQIISNDTGLAHAAGAMNKDLIILWKNTKLPKNGNPGKNTTIKLVR